MRTIRYTLLVSSLLALFCTNIHDVNASSERPVVYFNNEKLDIFAGVTYVPFRSIFQKFNMSVVWDNDAVINIQTSKN